MSRKANGFTLIELLVVITVIAILAGLVGPMVFQNVGDAKVSAAKAQIELFALALDAYRLDNDYYPSTGQGLDALRSRPTGLPDARNWRGPYLRKELPLDPWAALRLPIPGDGKPGQLRPPLLRTRWATGGFGRGRGRHQLARNGTGQAVTASG